jgi:hypothetical protein
MDKESQDQIQEIHVMPTKDCIEHIESEECLCSPIHDAKNKWDLKEGRADKVVWGHTLIWCERQ